MCLPLTTTQDTESTTWVGNTPNDDGVGPLSWMSPVSSRPSITVDGVVATKLYYTATSQLPNFPASQAYSRWEVAGGLSLVLMGGQSLGPTRDKSQGFTCHCPPAHHPVRGQQRSNVLPIGEPLAFLSEPQSSHAATPNYSSIAREASVC